MWELDYKESWVPKNWCFWTVVLEKTLESPLDCKEIQPVHPKGLVLGVHWKDWCWSWNSNTLAIWCEELTHLKRPWCWERLKAGGEGEDRGWDGFMASPTQWIWVWVNSGSWWWTGRPGMLRFIGSQRVRHDWTTEPNWTDDGNLISGSFAFSKSSLYIWKFLVHILLKPSLNDFEHYPASIWNEHICTAVWIFFAFLWNWDEDWPFPVLWPQLNFPNLLWWLITIIN